MSKEYQLNWPAHPNIYNEMSQRDFNIYFSEPDQGVNEDTGLVLLIPGFGGNANSNVYKKMRSNFADTYNLITVQCDYFGQEFMQGSNKFSINTSRESLASIFLKEEVEEIFNNGFNYNHFINVASHYPLNVVVKEILDESITNFNEMGIMQAIDNLTALTYVIQILKDNNLKFNTKKIILFGQSQGAYISYLCNAFAPDLFSLLIDNSSWLFPQYLKSPRFLYNQIGKATIQTEFNYFASQREYDEGILFLPLLYQQVDNKCKIECFHGTTDSLISHIEKRDFCRGIKDCHYNEVDINDIDDVIFKSTNHGLDADFLKLFDYVFKNTTFERGHEISQRTVSFETNRANYLIDYRDGIPMMNVIMK